MAKGTVAKQKVTETIREAFGINFIGEYDKKLYVLANDGGEMVQIAISLTCPKVQVEFAASTPVGDYNFEDDAPTQVVAASAFQPADITEEERARVNDLMKKLGL